MSQKQKFSQEPRGPLRHLFVCMFSVVSHSLWSHGLQPTRLLFLWDFSGKNTGTGCHSLLQEFFPTQGSNSCILCLLHCRCILYPEPPGKPLVFSFTVAEVKRRLQEEPLVAQTPHWQNHSSLQRSIILRWWCSTKEMRPASWRKEVRNTNHDQVTKCKYEQL